MKSGQTTIKDIAKALNISPSTVSRALKDHPDISAETKKSVLELAHKLDYQPNSIALSLRQSKTHTVGLIIPKIVNHFFSTVISGIEQVVHDEGYNIIMAQSQESYQREVESVQTMILSRVDGLFVSISRETYDYEHFREIEKRGIPLIFFDRICPDIDTDQVVIEDFEGSLQAVEHLIQIGCRNIVHLAGPQSLLISQERRRGYIEAHRQYGLAIQPELIILSDSHQLGFETVTRLISQGKKIDGIFAVNDDTAIGAMMAIKQTGLRIPLDIAVIGFENAPVAEVVEPSLSTIEQPGFEMGQIAAQLFLKQMDEDILHQPVQSKLKTRLIIRESSCREAEKFIGD
ncbi:MAG: LacI family DNA-binding transcriptional regulator [Microscillaceae bacterium]|nr:LacI family DNA-binding transcriptional regulator [Microscillaceae bacterium]